MNRKEVLSEVERDMKALYDRMVKKLLERADGDSLANVAGKRLKAVQLDLAEDIFTNDKLPGLRKLSHEEQAA